MNQRRHAARDGSFARSAGSAMGRGVVLVVVAVLIGALLMQQAFDADTSTVVGPGTVVTTAKPSATTSEGDTNGTTDTTTPPTDTTTPPVSDTKAPNTVTVLVANGSGVNGAAGRMADDLKPIGYVTFTANAKANVTATAVYFVEGFQADAAAVASIIKANPAGVKPLPVPAPVSDTKNAQVLVVLGPDLARAA